MGPSGDDQLDSVPPGGCNERSYDLGTGSEHGQSQDAGRSVAEVAGEKGRLVGRGVTQTAGVAEIEYGERGVRQTPKDRGGQVGRTEWYVAERMTEVWGDEEEVEGYSVLGS